MCARNVKDAVSRGYRHIKLHEFDLRCIRAARDAAPRDIPLMLDINCVWDTEAEAVQFCEDVAGLNIGWVEEPIWPPEDIPRHRAHPRRRRTVPISAGECNGTVEDFCRTFEAARRRCRAAVHHQDRRRLGACWRLRNWRARPVCGVVPHCPYFGPGLLATLHFLAATEEAEPIEIYFADLPARALWRGAGAEGAGSSRCRRRPASGWSPTSGSTPAGCAAARQWRRRAWRHRSSAA